MSSNSRWYLDTQHSFSFKADTKFRALHYNKSICCVESDCHRLYAVQFMIFRNIENEKVEQKSDISA